METMTVGSLQAEIDMLRETLKAAGLGSPDEIEVNVRLEGGLHTGYLYLKEPPRIDQESELFCIVVTI